jgi:hypothetical protein
MATLTGLYISQSYGGVIHLSTNTGITTGSATQLQDGFGTNLGVWLNGQGNVSASTFTGLASNATSASYAVNATSASYAPSWTTSSTDIQVNGHRVGRGVGNIDTNLAVGFRALVSSSAVSSKNTGIGYSGGAGIISGSDNTAVGYGVMGTRFQGSKNTAVGSDAMSDLSFYDTFTENVAIGYRAHSSGYDGVGNIMIGSNAGSGLNYGSYNTAIGYNALASGSFAGSNVAIGAFAGQEYTEPSASKNLGNNTFIGYNTGRNITAVGRNNTVIGANVDLGSIGFSGGATGGNIVLADGSGTPRLWYRGTGTGDWQGAWLFTATTIVTGSFIVSGSLTQNISTITGSGPVSTRYLDCSLGSFFTILLHGGSTVNLVPSNIKPGMRISLRVQNAFDVASYLNLSSGVSGSAPIQYFTQPSGSAYVTTQKLNAVDILEFSSFNNNQLNLTSVMKDVINA